ncbi:DNA polymerase epsilon subunit 2 [Eucyclogobius newberryi]|uniref:DNA polymerase epsilon subunit 2 n=1 Tax=Eucyclogobius newberryi TaxID=166745 RepID=UPI003B58DA0E
MDAARDVKTKVSAGFKMRGLLLRPDASRFLVELLESVSAAELDAVTERVLDAVEKQPLVSSVIELSVLQSAVRECTRDGDDAGDHVFNIIGAYDVPRYVYNAQRKKFLLATAPGSLCGPARDKAELFRERYTVLQQRTHRHELFTPPAVGTVVGEGHNKFQLKTIDALLGSTAKLGEVIVLGMITQLKEGQFHLEDPSGTVQLDMSHAQFHNGLYTESCFILAEGWYEDGVFHVSGVGFPPTEPAAATRAYYGDVNFFGGPSNMSVKASAKLKQLEEENEDAMFVLVSDVWLDSVEVMEKLDLMFSGYAATPPTCFVFCGNFSSAPFGKTQIKSLRESLRALADLICSHPSIHGGSRFVFVPGPEDPGPGGILPRPPLADYITAEFRERVPFSVFSTNPCRVQYCSQELVLLREDMVNKMCRSCVRLPNAGLDIPDHFVKSVLSQAHLAPLPLSVSPVFWAYDGALRVYPVPDVIVFADKYEPFSVTHSECLCLNPGSFPRSGFRFKVYYPSSRTAEDSALTPMPAP